MITIMRKDIVRLWGEFNYALDNFFPKRFKHIFYITMLLPYLTNSIAKTFYILYPIEIAYRIDFELFQLNMFWVFFIFAYRISRVIRNEWQTKNE